MANSGGREHSFDSDENLTIGEVRTLRFTVEDADGDNVDDFTGWEFEWFLINTLATANGLAQLRDKAIVHKDDDAITASAPTVDVPLGVDDWPNKSGSHYGHELWRVDTGNVRRLSYGRFVVID